MISLDKDQVDYLEKFGISLANNQVEFLKAFSSTQISLDIGTIKRVDFRPCIPPRWVKIQSFISRVLTYNKETDTFYKSEFLDYRYSYDIIFYLKDGSLCMKKVEDIDLFKLKKILLKFNASLTS